jgi:hypothetical protein
MNSVEKICQFRVFLQGVEPQIWRRLLVPDGFTLAKLHTIIQVAMGWQDCHLHEFSLGELRYGRPDYDEDPALLDERKIRLRDFDLSSRDRIGYLYDFGDDWEHVLILEEKQVPDVGTLYPACVAGERAAPPEDVGGSYGYEDFLIALSDPRHEEHQQMIDWIGGRFDPETFDLNRVNRRLRQRFRPRKRA